MNNEQGMLHYTLLFIIFIYHPEWVGCSKSMIFFCTVFDLDKEAFY